MPIEQTKLRRTIVDNTINTEFSFGVFLTGATLLLAPAALFKIASAITGPNRVTEMAALALVATQAARLIIRKGRTAAFVNAARQEFTARNWLRFSPEWPGLSARFKQIEDKSRRSNLESPSQESFSTELMSPKLRAGLWLASMRTGVQCVWPIQTTKGAQSQPG